MATVDVPELLLDGIFDSVQVSMREVQGHMGGASTPAFTVDVHGEGEITLWIDGQGGSWLKDGSQAITVSVFDLYKQLQEEASKG